MDKEQVKKAFDFFEKDEFSDAKEILKKEIKIINQIIASIIKIIFPLFLWWIKFYLFYNLF